jgi:glycosyltransferase involved in cell wall biosynthesis/GT2 family glycosyltransferase
VTVSVVVPVKDGARFLDELLAALAGEDVLVIDSGSADGSVAIARRHGVRVHEIAPHEFGHGRTRNLGAELTDGDVIAFLTQDATPLPGWREAIEEALAAHPEAGAVFGPHLPRPDTSPMIARELDGFFAQFARSPVRTADLWLSNVNAAYRRDCWAQLRFADVAYSEDQRFAAAMEQAGWAAVYAPGMAVLHAHDYPPVQFLRRYFDEYRGLRESVGHVEGFGVRSAVRTVRREVAADRAFLRERGAAPREIARWTARATVHHAGRRVFSALGSRAAALPAPVQRAISLEGTVTTAAPAPDPTPTAVHIPGLDGYEFTAVGELAARGPAPLLAPRSADGPLHVAVVLPHFQRGSGGHTTLFELCWRLEQAGHTLSYWLHDPVGLDRAFPASRVRGNAREWFAPVEGPFFKGYDDWFGCDVALATGWQTAHPTALLPGCHAKAYLVQDHETEFYASSVERRWAEETYRMGFHGICASPWLADIVTGYGGTASVFDLGVEPETYHLQDRPRRRDTLVMYGRDVTARRAVPLAVLAVARLLESRPHLRVQSFGNGRPVGAPFAHEHLGILSPAQLARVYAESTVGIVLSLTNYSRIPKEMLACGLPVVDLAGISAESVFGADGPVALAPPTVDGLADTIAGLLDDEDAWRRRSEAGVAFVAGHTWDRAARQLEDGLREALRRRAA